MSKQAIIADELDDAVDDVYAKLTDQPTIRELLEEILKELKILNGYRNYPQGSSVTTSTNTWPYGNFTYTQII